MHAIKCPPPMHFGMVQSQEERTAQFFPKGLAATRRKLAHWFVLTTPTEALANTGMLVEDFEHHGGEKLRAGRIFL